MIKAVSLMLTLAMCLAIPLAASGAAYAYASYTDVALGSDWAMEELRKAADMGLVPDSLKGQDLTRPITRAEFAAVSVKTYEALSGTAAVPATANPFTDTADAEVLKALNVGITVGISANLFDPGALLDREQAATMLTRVYKRIALDGWSMQADSRYTLQYTKPGLFADDANISDWAKDSVYFMAANEIIKGMGGNTFAPKNMTREQEASGYANATREQALLIAVRMLENADSAYAALANSTVSDESNAENGGGANSNNGNNGGNGGNSGNGGNNSNNSNNSGNNGIVTLNADELNPATTNTTPNPAEDSKSKAALIGSWSHMDSGRLTAWAFDENGRFAGYLIAQTNNYYTDAYGYTYSRATSAYKHLLQGNYVVTGGIIRFSNCQISTTMEFDKYPNRTDGLYDAMNDLLVARLDNPKVEEDFVAEFEFIDSARLRIRVNRNVIEDYDLNFNWDGGAHNVALPTHRIPEAIWPAGSLSPDMPLYGDSGRLRKVAQNGEGEFIENYTTTVTVDRTSHSALLGYAAKLRQAGWSGPGEQEILDAKKKAEDSVTSLLFSYYSFDYYKGVYRLNFGVDADDSLRITSSREVEGFWPSEFWGDAFKPPEGVVYIGAIDMENIFDFDGNIYLSFKIDFYPSTPESYINGLLQNGFVVYETIYSRPEISAFMRIDGLVFKVMLEEGYDNNGTIATMNYRLKYYPDFEWPADTPPGIPTPTGYELFYNGADSVGKSMSMDGVSYSITFVTIGMPEADVQAYFDSLLASGWEVSIVPSGAFYKIMPWNGNNWICHISGGYTYANATEFKVAFQIYNY
ncbi:MAG: S-layer homology domain-containing protein [Oscillospiraceae bacterium]|nr:S-layer homology domain-containing protein [Oscillospiraceae bacterium]